MLTKAIVAVAAFAALAEQALAFNSHRNLHRRYHLDKREQHVEYVTVWTTVYADAAQETEAPPHKFYANVAPSQDPPAPLTTLATAAKPLIDIKPASPAADYGDKPAPAPAPTPARHSDSKSSGSGGAVFPGKRGVAYNDAKLANNLSNQCKKCAWAYNWGSSPQGLDSGINFVPTLWGDQPRFTDRWESDAQKALSNGAKAMFSFNEPDNGGQANMSPQQAAAAHVRYMNPFGGKALIGSPAVTNSGQAGQGIQWLKSFMSECDKQQDKCRIDFCAVHWYSQPQYEDTLYDHLEQAHKACGGKPVWLTEFASVDGAGKPTASSEFISSVIPKLDGMSFVHAYAPFMCSEGNLMSANQLSEAGRAFIS